MSWCADFEFRGGIGRGLDNERMKKERPDIFNQARYIHLVRHSPSQPPSQLSTHKPPPPTLPDPCSRLSFCLPQEAGDLFLWDDR